FKKMVAGVRWVPTILEKIELKPPTVHFLLGPNGGVQPGGSIVPVSLFLTCLTPQDMSWNLPRGNSAGLCLNLDSFL
ncbi:MAG: hypothetical protein QXW77_01990, partial [Candidatus Hadarchaeales archaeon]